MEPTGICRVLQSYLEKSTLETTFDWCVSQVIVPEPPQTSSLLEAIQSIFTNNSMEHWPLYINEYINYLINQSNPHRVQLLITILEKLVAKNIIPSKLICERILTQLDINNLLTWQHGLSLIHSVIGGVDYKGCREVMKLLLDKFDKIPRSIPDQQVSALHEGRKVFGYILDRNAALLPAYIAHDEIQLRYITNDTTPHWALKDIIASLKGSMKLIAQIVSGNMLPHLIPVVGLSNTAGTAWKLDTVKSCFCLPGRLPYSESLLSPQDELIYQVLSQPQSKDAIIAMLNIVNIGKVPQIHNVLEECMERLLFEGVKETDKENDNIEGYIQIWNHISNQFLVMSLIQIIKPTKVFNSLIKKLSGTNFRQGRYYFMWLLLNFLSNTGSSKDQSVIQEECDAVCRMISSLYTDTEPLDVPSTDDPSCVYVLAGASVWMVLTKKSEVSNISLLIDTPVAFKKHLEFLQSLLDSCTSGSSCYTFTVLLNANYMSNDISSNILTTLLGSAVTGSDASLHPLPFPCVNLMVVQVKAKLADKIKLQLMKAADATKQSQSNTTPLVTSSLLETFSRVLLWSGTKTFQSQLIPVVFKLQDWGMLQSLLEVISYRVHYQLQMSSRFQILILLHSIAGVTIIPTQLFICAENTALHLLLGLVTNELPTQLVKSPADPKTLFHVDSDELNKTLLLSLAQSLSITKVDLGVWLDNLFKEIDSSMFLWPESSLSFLPPSLQQVCHTPSQEMSRQTMVTRVEEEYQKLSSKSEPELQQSYTEGDTSSYIFCIMWKQLLETGQITPIVSRLFQRLRLSPKKQTSLLRTLMDYIVYTSPYSFNSPQFNNIVSYLNDMIWKYFLCPLDRLVLCILWRDYSGQDSIKAINIVHHLLMSEQIITRLNDFIETVPVSHDTNWDEKHASFKSHYPECFTFDSTGTSTISSTTYNMSFGNVCLRLLPVIDLTIQRMIECPQTYQSLLEQLLEKYKRLYRYHDSPIHFMYTVCHYYSSVLTESPNVKYHLISSIITSLPLEQTSQRMRFSSLFMDNIKGSLSFFPLPSSSYWQSIISHINDVVSPFKNFSSSHLSWPLCEHTNPGSCLLMTAALEIMSMPFPIQQLVQSLINTAVTLYINGPTNEQTFGFLNITGALFSILPGSYSSVLYDEMCSLFQSQPFNATDTKEYIELVNGPTRSACILSLAHSYLHHSSVSVATGLTHWLKIKVKPILTNEIQLLYLCHFLAAILNRLSIEKPTLLLQVVDELYQLIQKVDGLQEGIIANCDPICDLLYHIKYRHIGDYKRDDIEKIVSSLHHPLKLRLRFLVQTSDGRGTTPVMPVAPISQELLQ